MQPTLLDDSDLIDDADDEPLAGESPRSRAPRRRLAWLGLVTLVVTAVVVAVVTVERAPVDPLERAQTEEDRAVPFWLANALGYAGQRAEDPLLEDRLLDSVRLLPGEDGLDAYIFTESSTGTYCLAAAESIICTSTGVYKLNGLQIDIADPDSRTGLGGIRYRYSEASGYEGSRVVLSDPASVRILRPSEWPALVEQCMGERGFVVAADPQGAIVAAPVADEATLELSMAIYNCRLRYPLNATYYSFEG